MLAQYDPEQVYPDQYQQGDPLLMSHQGYNGHQFALQQGGPVGGPEKYNFAKSVQNYTPPPTDGMYCYSCVMFLGVFLIGAGIIGVIVELFGLFGPNHQIPIAYAVQDLCLSPSVQCSQVFRYPIDDFNNSNPISPYNSGAGVTSLGVAILAGSMLCWQRKRKSQKKKTVRV
eukprot:sb/3472132/